MSSKLWNPEQDFAKLKAECLAAGKLFEDDAFPCDLKSLCFTRGSYNRWSNIEWKRPKEIVSDPQMFLEGPSRHDLKQGGLGDCWFLAASSSLAMHPKLLHKVIPVDNCFKEGEYAGIFHFKFCECGVWYDIVVDDRLPTTEGELAFLRPNEDAPNEFWAPLLEKAYAKFHGTYEAIEGGWATEAFDNLTGAFMLTIPFAQQLESSWTHVEQVMEVLDRCFKSGGIAWTGTFRGTQGIVSGHAYSITGLAGDKVRLRNPWGQSEWHGPWGDDSPLWKYVPESQKEEWGYANKNDGEFFMYVKDFIDNFNQMDVCYFSPDALDYDEEGKGDGKWFNWQASGKWERGVSDGGSPNYIWTFHSNPQYQVTVGEEGGESASIMLALTQKKGERGRSYEFLEQDQSKIGVTVYDMQTYQKKWIGRQDMAFFKDKYPEKGGNFEQNIKICERFTLSPGTYFFIPSTATPNRVGEFHIQILSDKPLSVVYPEEKLGDTFNGF